MQMSISYRVFDSFIQNIINAECYRQIYTRLNRKPTDIHWKKNYRKLFFFKSARVSRARTLRTVVYTATAVTGLSRRIYVYIHYICKYLKLYTRGIYIYFIRGGALGRVRGSARTERRDCARLLEEADAGKRRRRDGEGEA